MPEASMAMPWGAEPVVAQLTVVVIAVAFPANPRAKAATIASTKPKTLML